MMPAAKDLNKPVFFLLLSCARNVTKSIILISFLPSFGFEIELSRKIVTDKQD